MKRTNKNIKQNIFMISLIIIEVTQKIRIMETIMNRIFQKFLQSVIDLSSVGAKCREDNTHEFAKQDFTWFKFTTVQMVSATLNSLKTLHLVLLFLIG